MKKITLLFVFLFMAGLAWSQAPCAPGPDGQYPSSTITVNADGSSTTISTCNYSSEFSVIDGVVPGNDYEVRITLAGANLYVTVENSADDSVIAHGASPFTFTAPAGVTGLHLNWSEDDQCTYVDSGCRVTSIQDLTVAAEGCGAPGNVVLDDLTTDSADISWEDASGNAVDFLVELYLEGESAENGDTPLVSETNVAAAMYSFTGLTESTAYDLYLQSNCSGDPSTSDLVGPLNFTTLTPAPANDDFDNAIDVECGMNYLGSTAGATLDEDDAPDQPGGADLDAPNVWFSYTGSGSQEDVTLNLCPSDYDSSVLVYTGTSGNLTLVAANDDGGTANCGSGNGTRSFLTFASDGTTTYWITVEGWNSGNTGNYDMTVSCAGGTPAPENDECVAAEMLDLGVPSSGTTVGATQNLAEEQPTCDSFGTIADVWYSVVLTEASDLTVMTTITGTSDQANVAIYTACGGLEDDSVGCSNGNGGETLSVDNLAAGTYFIRVWSDGSAATPPTGRTEGTFDIVATTTLSTDEFAQGAFTYYPNPVKNTLTLNAQNNIENVRMYNMLGQEVMRVVPNALNSDLDMSNLQDGAYFVKVTIANVTSTIRVIKQ